MNLTHVGSNRLMENNMAADTLGSRECINNKRQGVIKKTFSKLSHPRKTLIYKISDTCILKPENISAGTLQMIQCLDDFPTCPLTTGHQ